MRVLTEQDLQEELKISVKQAQALMRAEEFPSVQIGRVYRVTEQDLYDWMKNTKSIKLKYAKC